MPIRRRDLLRHSAVLASTIWVSTRLSGCTLGSDRSALSSASFSHGVASGDPTAEGIMLWTRAVPQTAAGTVELGWELADDADFRRVIRSGRVTTTAERDFTVKLDVDELQPGQEYFYRFLSKERASTIGRTRTLPTGSPSSLRMAVFSCSNYPAGYFHAYREAARLPNIDVFVHLGDYFYEYGMGGYGTDRAVELGRALPENNAGELYTLDDYRRRYGVYRGDEDLQALHASAPMIAVWDDHEIANDTWMDGAENHSAEEGDFAARKAAAVQAYFEWMPLRPVVPDEDGRIYRRFDFGDLLSMHMLDTRLIGRDEQLAYGDFLDKDSGELDGKRFQQQLYAPERSLLGSAQREWLYEGLATSPAHWQVLGQQVLMARMEMPAQLLRGLFSGGEAGATQALIGDLVADKQALLAGEALGVERTQRLAQKLPYNLDAWDGYPMEREGLYERVRALGKEIVVLAGDTHNAWHSQLHDREGVRVGTEFATPGVSSPGMETYLNLDEASAQALAQGLGVLIDELQYCQLYNRGFLELEYTRRDVHARWHFIDDVTREDYATFSKAVSLNQGAV